MEKFLTPRGKNNSMMFSLSFQAKFYILEEEYEKKKSSSYTFCDVQQVWNIWNIKEYYMSYKGLMLCVLNFKFQINMISALILHGLILLSLN